MKKQMKDLRFFFKKKIIKSIKKNKPKLFCLPNSDSPSGHAFKINEIEKILSAARQVNSFVLIDEAYYPFFLIHV